MHVSGLILHDHRIETFKLTFLRKREKLENKHLFLIAISGDSPFLPRDDNFFSDCSELPSRLRSATILQSHTTYIYFQLPLSLTFKFQDRVDFDQICLIFSLFDYCFLLLDVIRALLIVRETSSKHELHSINKSTSYSRLDKDLIRLTLYSYPSSS